MATNSEFSFHVHKKTGNAQSPALYTIGLWEGTVLRGICHTQPLDGALAAVRLVLEESGKAAGPQESCQHCGNEVTP